MRLNRVLEANLFRLREEELRREFDLTRDHRPEPATMSLRLRRAVLGAAASILVLVAITLLRSDSSFSGATTPSRAPYRRVSNSRLTGGRHTPGMMRGRRGDEGLHRQPA
jgi:hypothetical protein